MPLTSGLLGVPIALLLAASSPLAQGAAQEPCPPPARAETCTPRVVRVSMYNQSRMRPGDIERLLAVANAIWAPYGVVLEMSSGPGTVAVVLRNGSSVPDDTGRMVLGTTLFADGHATPYMRLSLAAAEAFADDSDAGDGVPYNLRPREMRNDLLMRILGVALAHEMAHYLLDTARHSRGGLLQAGLGIRDLASPNPDRLKLTTAQWRLLCHAATPFCTR